ncbi:MAG: hypothetical protein HGA62_03770 [Chlorobiaceae bacterium]|nr:hypothetical protein [Chlorobiaceae bacterium]NTV59853.1 hypothetical protein [Chlorobiaceae bacterium]
MKRKAHLFLYAALVAVTLTGALFIINQVSAAAALVGRLHPYAGIVFILLSSAVLLAVFFHAFLLFRAPKAPELPEQENSGSMASYASWLASRMPVHPQHPEPNKKGKDLRWVRTNLKFLEVDALNATKQIASKNFFVGAFAQNTSYGTTTSLMNIFRVVWQVYRIHYREQHLMEFLRVVRAVYTYLPLSDFRKEDIPAHIKPIVQSAFSNTLSSMLPAGNLLTPFFLNLFIAGATNTYLTCLAGIIAIRQCQLTTEEDRKEVMQHSMFETSFLLKEIVKECNPVLSVTISNAVKKAGIESLDTVQNPPSGSGIAQEIVSHLATSLKHIIRENISIQKNED